MKRGPALVLMAFWAVAVGAATAPQERGRSGKAPMVRQPMRPEEPMATGMMKPGMKKGDVSKSAGTKEAEMKPMMEQEEKSMPARPGGRR